MLARYLVLCPTAPDPSGNICVNTYTFDPAEELISCCACLVTPNALSSLSQQQLAGCYTHAGAAHFGRHQAAGMDSGRRNLQCGRAVPIRAVGMRAWGSTLHALPTSPVTYDNTETPFSQLNPE